MNITGYKKKYKLLVDTFRNTEIKLRKEQNKPEYARDDDWIEGMKAKLETLHSAKNDCSKRIKNLQKAKKKK